MTKATRIRGVVEAEKLLDALMHDLNSDLFDLKPGTVEAMITLDRIRRKIRGRTRSLTRRPQ